MRPREPRRVLGAVAMIILLAVAGCGSEEPPVPPTRSVPPSPAPTPGADRTPSPSVPVDGVTLRSLGFLNGPAEQFTLPRTTLISAAVDQANNVTAVLSAPPPADVATHLRQSLPATGFTITADDAEGAALTFVGHGWTGSYTASDATSAILLRPI